jgi:hypothetical protein
VRELSISDTSSADLSALSMAIHRIKHFARSEREPYRERGEMAGVFDVLYGLEEILRIREVNQIFSGRAVKMLEKLRKKAFF